MKDFYAAMGLSADAADDTIRTALAKAPADMRADAEFILLDPRRRAVYDRNHALLTTIGRLRAHLGLSYTRFWARHEYKDFWTELAPTSQQPKGKRVDAALIAGAFAAVGRQGRKHVTRGSNWLIALMVAIAFIVAFLIVHLAR